MRNSYQLTAFNHKGNPAFTSTSLFEVLAKDKNNGIICGTTTRNGNRNRYISGIFLSQIPQDELLTQSFNTEFAVRLRDRTKASGLPTRTNKIRSFRGVVDTLPHPTKGGKSSILNTEKNSMNTYQLIAFDLDGNPAFTSHYPTFKQACEVSEYLKTTGFYSEITISNPNGLGGEDD